MGQDIRVINSNDSLIIVSDENRDVQICLKSEMTFSGTDGNVAILKNGQGVITAPPEDWLSPSGDSAYDIIEQLEILRADSVSIVNSDKVISVSATDPGADYSTIEDAVASSEAGDIILVLPGTYNEDPITCKANTIRGLALASVTVVANNSAAPLFTTSTGSRIQYLTISGPTSSDSVLVNNIIDVFLDNIVFNAGQTSIHVSGATALAIAEECSFNSTGINRGIEVDTGGEIIASSLVSVADTFCYSTGSGSIITAHNSIIISSTNAFYALSSGEIRIASVTCSNCVNVVRTDTSGIINGLGIQSFGSSTFDILQEDTLSSIRLTGCLFDSDKISFQNAANINVQFNDSKSGDKGANVVGELHVGTIELGAESVMGEGDSYTSGMMVYTFNGSTYADISSNAADETTANVSLPGIGLNNSIYMSSDRDASSGDFHQFFGYKVIIDTAITLGGGSYIHEYWNGSAWVEATVMAADANSPYLPHAQAVYETTTTKQVRFNDRIGIDWTKNDPPTTGTSRYWVRIRVDSAITASFIVNQIKLHSNRTEINSDGWMEYFGKARPVGDLRLDIGLLEPASASPSNQDLFLSDNLDKGAVENLFTNVALDRSTFLFFLPFDLDTSTPIHFVWAVQTSNASAGNIEWTIRWGYSSDGDNVYTSAGTAPTAGPNEQSQVVTEAAPVAADTAIYYGAYLAIEDMVSRVSGDIKAGDILWVSIERDGGSGGDTHTGDVALIQVVSHYVKWCVGGHL